MTKLSEIIAKEIRDKDVISFARFMELALYCPDYGFYEKERDNLGAAGHFYTSVSVGPLFGELLAVQFAEWFDGSKTDETVPSAGSSAGFQPSVSPISNRQAAQTGPATEKIARPAGWKPAIQQVGNLRYDGVSHQAAAGESPISDIRSPISYHLVEAGAHDGRLAADILNWFAVHRPDLLTQIEYCIIEPSSHRRNWQRKTLIKFPDRVRWVSSLADLPCHSSPASRHLFQIIFCNELLDAIPVHRFAWDANAKAWFEWGVSLIAGNFAWAKMQPPIEWLNDSTVQRFNGSTLPRFDVSTRERLTSVLPDGFVMDICPAAELWWQTAAQSLVRGKLLTLDYGLTAEELLQPERKDGTLRGYYQHRMTTDVLANPGEQDLTAHVNFSAIQVAGEAAGLWTERFVSQEQVLTEIVARISQKESAALDLNSAQKRQFQTLTHPNLMGRQFRVLIQSR